jgi:hypothetical protein
VCSLIIINSFFKITYHTKLTKIQILPKWKFLQIFRFVNFAGYNRSMAILDNLDDGYPLFESESFSGGIQDICSNGCNCTSEHEFIQDFIDFEQ